MVIVWYLNHHTNWLTFAYHCILYICIPWYLIHATSNSKNFQKTWNSLCLYINAFETAQDGHAGQEQQANQWSSCCRSNPYLLSPTPNPQHTHTQNLASSSNTQPSPERTLMRAGVASIQSSSIHHCTIIPEQSSTHNYCPVSLHRTLPCNAHMQMHAAIPPPPLYELSKTPSLCPWPTIM